MSNSKTIFGFGSLIYIPSLLASAPNAANIRPAYIKGFIRCFSFWDAVGYTVNNLDVANEAMCALDVAKTNNTESRVNGVAFTVGEPESSNLLRREEGYKLIPTPVYDYETGQLITNNGLVFSANKNDGKYAFGGKAQQRYLEDYLKAAKQYGDKFYQEVLDTTFIDNQPLSQDTRLSALL